MSLPAERRNDMKKIEQHTRSYYEERIRKTADFDTINRLLDEAAKQPEKVIPHDDFVVLYWLANDILRGENE
jgi:hypothetical protein